MSASLVGSEMCIRDRPGSALSGGSDVSTFRAAERAIWPVGRAGTATSRGAVSYTHLTLPTICSV
eukprot:10802497-Alexandrium_andersonii.AAC.1